MALSVQRRSANVNLKMAQINVTQFAKELGLPLDLLLEQLQTAGVKKKFTDDTVLTEKDKTQLLDYLCQSHGARETKNKMLRAPHAYALAEKDLKRLWAGSL